MLPILSLLDTSKEDVLNAFVLPYANGFKDDFLMETSLTEETDFVLTRNLKDHVASSVKILSSSQFLQMEKSL